MSFLKSIYRRGRSLKTFVVRQWWYLKRKFRTPTLPENSDGKIYVNLGSGVHTSSEFINVDTRPFPWIHYINDVQALPMFASGKVDLIYASHLVEHVPRGELHAALQEWYRVLKPGGILRIGVPDFDSLIEVYKLSGLNVHSIENQLLGQNAPYDDHHTIWNMKFAEEVMKKAGFKEIRVWNPETVDHHGFGDKSKRKIEIGGRSILISLNIEAEK